MDSTEVIYLPTASGPMPIATQINGRLYAIDSDHLNTPRRLTNSQGQVAWQWLISGYGEVQPTTGAQGYAQNNTGSRSYSEAIKFDLRYPGQQWDEETGLAYNLHRYYDALTGRYIQADPIGLEGGWNRFGYVGGNPLGFIDPDGLQAYNGQQPPPSMPGGPWTPAGPGQPPGTFYGPQNPNGGPRDVCRYVPDGSNGGPLSAKDSYWKTKEPGKPWTRFDQNGNPITQEQAHPGNQNNRPISPLGIPGRIPLYPLVCPLCNVLMPSPNGPS